MNNYGNGRPSGKVVLYAAASIYLLYIGISLIRDHLAGRSAMAPWLSWGFGIFFVLSAAFIGWTTWKRYKKEAATAMEETETEAEEELPAEDETEGEQPELPAEITPEAAENTSENALNAED